MTIQWGYRNGDSWYGLTWVVLPIAYNDNTYVIAGTQSVISSDNEFTSSSTESARGATNKSGCIYNKTPTGFNIQRYSSRYWLTVGYTY